MLSKRLSLLAILTLILAAAPAAAQPPGTQVEFGTKGGVEIPLGDSTEVRGKIPQDLTGTWLVVEEHKLPIGPDKIFATLQLYAVAKGADGSPVVYWYPFAPPAEVAADLKTAQAAQKPWAPNDAQIAAIIAALRAKPARADRDQRARHIVSQPDKLDELSAKAPVSQGAKFAVQSLIQLADRPLFGQSYFIKKTGKDELGGDMTMGAVPQNAKGVPLPIGTTGTFRWIRLDLPPPPAPTAAVAPTTVATPAAPTPAAKK